METASDVLSAHKARVERELERVLPSAPQQVAAPRLWQAMRHAVMAGGKRLRPALALTAAETVGAEAETALPVAVALELIHTYSLVHDDLPCMDDDALRRGQPTVHVAFGEDVAVLAGDALLTKAFEVLSDGRLVASAGAERFARIVAEVAGAIGADGMVAGQILDMEAEGQNVPLEALEQVHRHKTAALIRASVVAGALAGGGENSEIEALRRFGESTGLAFQVVDDLLDAYASTEELGKPGGSDARNDKSTYVALLGPRGCREHANALLQGALDTLNACFGERGAALSELARLLVNRTR